MRGRPHAFTLIELLVVIVLVAAVGGLAAAGIGASARSGQRRAALVGVLESLTVARIEAMRSGEPKRVIVRASGDRLVASTPEKNREWRSAGLRLVGPRDEHVGAAVVFGGSGRCEGDALHFVVAEAGGNAGRMWKIEFDPVSGAPSLAEAAAGGDREDSR